MTYTEAMIYGAVQGVTEYLPISSSAHLILLPKFLRTQDPGLTFDVFLHMGTLLATLIYFWREWRDILFTLPGFEKYGMARQGWPQSEPLVSWKLIVVATLPALAAGALFHDWVETVLRGNQVLASTLVAGGILLVLADAICARRRSLGSARVSDALWIGIAQCFALMPGMSRSGSTIIGGRLLGFDRSSAAKFSFLISAPVTAAAVVFELRNWDRLFDGTIALGPLLVAGFSSFVFGCLAIGGLLRLLKRFGFLSFAVYRLALALTIFQVLGV